ncbi:MAG: F0F1 ATP synthase subunit B [Deltaproteobacteria bacterium]|jgi:F-type H+-transporting ATPase subunit b|nr:F0F1 ATP synthase subunit B [Deltaproteobacteria bacterium]MBW2570969.1 F0F1 ATP synthase subunit B [Deltaproteobacteria bacterium]MBW2669320.1 F0F1 ATP synthase subunit B [Deltaproteobacteria bacterium]
MHIASNVALISINATLFFQLISFLIFLFIINRLMFRPLRNVMGERDNYINKILQEIRDTKNEFENLTNQLQQQESAVKDEASKLQKEIEDTGKEKAAEILNSARQEIKTLKDKAQKAVDTQISEARKDIIKESEFLAVSIIEKVLDRRLVP